MMATTLSLSSSRLHCVGWRVRIAGSSDGWEHRIVVILSSTRGSDVLLHLLMKWRTRSWIDERLCERSWRTRLERNVEMRASERRREGA